MPKTVLLNSLAAGVYGNITALPAATRIKPFRSVMLIGSASSGPINTPTLYKSPTDFINQFAGSPEEDWVKLNIAELNAPSNATKYFIRAGVADTYTVTVSSATDGNYTLTINGQTVTFAGLATQTVTQIATNLAAAINSNITASALVTATASAGVITIRADNPTTELTVSVSAGNMTAVESTPTSPTRADYIYAIQNSFSSVRDPLSFVVAPVMAGMGNSDYTAMAAALNTLVADERYQWFAILDCQSTVATSPVQAFVGNKALCPANARNMAIYWPHVIDLFDNTVPASAAVLGAYLRNCALPGEGIKEPPAGPKCRFRSVKGLSYSSTIDDAEVTAENKLNILLNVENIGFTAWDCYTLSTDNNFQFISHNLIASVIYKTLKDSLLLYLFRSLGNRGQTISAIGTIAGSIMESAYQAGLLYAPDGGRNAYKVICDPNSQDPNALEDGLLYMEVAFVPVGLIRQIAFVLARAKTGEIETTLRYLN